MDTKSCVKPVLSNNPKIYYAQYSETLSSFTSSMINNEDPATSIFGAYPLERNLVKTIMDNPNSQVNFTFTFQTIDIDSGVWSYTADVNFYIGTYEKREKISSSIYNSCSSSWETKTLKGETSGQLILNRNCSLFVSLSTMNAVGFYTGKFKNLKYEATIMF